MSKVKLVVHECYAGKRKSEEVFAAVFLSNAAALTEKPYDYKDDNECDDYSAIHPPAAIASAISSTVAAVAFAAADLEARRVALNRQRA